MSLYDDVAREALSDWLDVRRDLAADELPDRAECEDAAAFDEKAGEFAAPSAPDHQGSER